MENPNHSMKYPWIEAYCQEKPSSEMDYKIEWEASRFMVRGKMYAMMGGDKEGRAIITLKLAPNNGQALRALYPNAVRPGYYMNKEHWNSVDLNGNVPDEVLKEMLDEAYELIFKSFSKKIQAEIQSN